VADSYSMELEEVLVNYANAERLYLRFKINDRLTMPVEQTARKSRFYVKAVQNWNLFRPLLTSRRYLPSICNLCLNYGALNFMTHPLLSRFSESLSSPSI
jgi:hypothetical protein